MNDGIKIRILKKVEFESIRNTEQIQINVREDKVEIISYLRDLLKEKPFDGKLIIPPGIDTFSNYNFFSWTIDNTTSNEAIIMDILNHFQSEFGFSVPRSIRKLFDI